MAILLAHSAARLGRATTVQCTCTPLARREREMSRDAAEKGLLAWTAESERTPGAQNDEGGKIRGLLAVGQEQRAGAICFRLSAIGQTRGLSAIGETEIAFVCSRSTAPLTLPLAIPCESAR